MDVSKEVERMEVEQDIMFAQGCEATLMMEKAMQSLTVLPEDRFMKEIIEKVLEESFWRARSSEIWSELYLGSQEIKIRVQQIMKEDQIKDIIESKRLIALELRKKRNLAKLQSEKCTDDYSRMFVYEYIKGRR